MQSGHIGGLELTSDEPASTAAGKESGVDRERCWSMVETAKAASGGDFQRQVALLEQRLRGLPLPEIVGFHQILDELHAESFGASCGALQRPSSPAPRTRFSPSGDG